MNIAFICVGNSCRSQMAEGYAKHFLKDLKSKHNIYSAGMNPKDQIHPLAIEVMK
jgi:arsenate reductase